MNAPYTPHSLANVKGYPDSPGAKVAGTSADAAVAIADHAKTVRRRALVAYAEAFPRGLTPDEVATTVKESILTVRPRCAELKRLGHIKPTGETRKNDSGHSASVMQITALGLEARA